MPHIAVTSIGSAGDVLPLLAVAKALADAGAAVTAVVEPQWIDRAKALGLVCRPIPGEPIPIAPQWSTTKSGAIDMLSTGIAPRAHDIYAAITAIHDDNPVNAVVGHHISFGAPWAAQAIGVPWIMAAVAPASWPSLANPNLYPGMPDRPLPRWSIRLGSALAKRRISRAIDPPLNAVRTGLGMPAQRHHMFDGQWSNTLNLGLWSPLFRAPAADDRTTCAVVGFPSLGPAQEPLAEDLRAFLDAGDPPLLISLGSTVAKAAPEHTESLISSASALGVRCIALTGIPDQPSTATVLRVGWADHDALLPHCAAVVHHGGIGSTAAALRAGVPSGVMPFAHDQPDNARRAHRLGLSLKMPRKPSAQGGVMRDLLEDSSLKSRCLAYSEGLAEEAFGAACARRVLAAIS